MTRTRNGTAKRIQAFNSIQPLTQHEEIRAIQKKQPNPDVAGSSTCAVRA